MVISKDTVHGRVVYVHTSFFLLLCCNFYRWHVNTHPHFLFLYLDDFLTLRSFKGSI